MKKFYAVCNTYYDDGRVIANLADIIEADEIPVDTYKETRRCDVYITWFDSYEKATKFLKICKMVTEGRK